MGGRRSSRLAPSRLCLGAERRRAWMRHDNYSDNDRGHETGSIGLGRSSCSCKGCVPPTGLSDPRLSDRLSFTKLLRENIEYVTSSNNSFYKINKFLFQQF
ncbi:hypothetical protein PUN28_011651 [Cardiocondyla obscurior]|uniref:Uncharacterized protein n=1 Tax=Cardiocondyla obscurior TaxID=286306 RepID=A0AAW2FHL5_9HYME